MADNQTLLLTDDDETFCKILKRALAKRGFDVKTANSVAEANECLEKAVPDCALVDLNMPNDSGLALIPRLKESNPDMKIVVLTGYASIATAVEAIKLGATNYLTKPSDADEIVHALHTNENTEETKIPRKPMTVNRMEWEHLQKVLTECKGNVSEAARQLGMHRRTLQRKLQKRPSRLE